MSDEVNLIEAESLVVTRDDEEREMVGCSSMNIEFQRKLEKFRGLLYSSVHIGNNNVRHT